jgi:transposase InsO family protein
LLKTSRSLSSATSISSIPHFFISGKKTFFEKGAAAFDRSPRPRIISDQGSQFKSREFKSFIAQWQASHVMTSPYYPQSIGKLERFHQTLKDQAIRPLTPLDLEEAKRVTGDFIEYYNTTRLHTAIGFIAPKDRL